MLLTDVDAHSLVKGNLERNDLPATIDQGGTSSKCIDCVNSLAGSIVLERECAWNVGQCASGEIGAPRQYAFCVSSHVPAQRLVYASSLLFERSATPE